MSARASTRTPLGVGILGAGPVTQAIHLPTLATLPDQFSVVHIMDVNATTAQSVAARVSARSSTTLEGLLADDRVDVVAICSPGEYHADQVAAVAAAGKLGILCEKPLATTLEQAQRISDISAATGIPVVVGAMHAYDPAWVAGAAAWAELGEDASLIRSTIYLPTNDEFVDLATDPAPSATAPAGGGQPPSAADLVRGGILGLATHTVPHVRRFLRGMPTVTHARAVSPWGYQLVFTDGERVGELLALMPGRWAPDWSFTAYAEKAQLTLQYPPSYVLAGSATATLSTRTGSDAQTRNWRSTDNGYQAEWRHLADVVHGRAELAVPVQDAVDDLLFALALADGADTCLGVSR